MKRRDVTPSESLSDEQQRSAHEKSSFSLSADALAATSSAVSEARLPASRSLSSATNGAHGMPLTVKKRRTKNFKWREDMAKARGTIDVRVPPLDPPTFATWDDFIRAWNDYMSATKTLYRRRSSSTTASWNSKNRFKKFPVPDSFQYATMAYWCTHGCIQPSRGTGVRAHLHNRFTGCSARITADVVYETTSDNDVHWFIRVRNQISQHNHKISDEIYHCYTNNSSVPDELLLGPSSEDLGDQNGSGSSPSPMMRSFESGGEEAEFDSSTGILGDLEGHEDADHRLGKRIPASMSALAAKEALMDERKLHMVRSELQPILIELKTTSSRVIHKRLQDVSEMVTHLLKKWNRDRAVEDQILSNARVVLANSNLPPPDEEDDEPSSSPSPPPLPRVQPPLPPVSIYGDGPGELLSPKFDTITATSASVSSSDGSANSSTASERPGSSSSTAVSVDGGELSRHRHSELV